MFEEIINDKNNIYYLYNKKINKYLNVDNESINY